MFASTRSKVRHIALVFSDIVDAAHKWAEKVGLVRVHGCPASILRLHLHSPESPESPDGHPYGNQ